MIAFRLVVVAGTLAYASIGGADGLAATRIESAREAKAFAERLPQASADRPVAVSRVVSPPRPGRRGEEAPAPRTCPERSWPYGAPRCIAGRDGVRVIALDRPAAREAL